MIHNRLGQPFARAQSPCLKTGGGSSWLAGGKPVIALSLLVSTLARTTQDQQDTETCDV